MTATDTRISQLKNRVCLEEAFTLAALWDDFSPLGSLWTFQESKPKHLTDRRTLFFLLYNSQNKRHMNLLWLGRRSGEDPSLCPQTFAVFLRSGVASRDPALQPSCVRLRVRRGDRSRRAQKHSGWWGMNVTHNRECCGGINSETQQWILSHGHGAVIVKSHHKWKYDRHIFRD